MFRSLTLALIISVLLSLAVDQAYSVQDNPAEKKPIVDEKVLEDIRFAILDNEFEKLKSLVEANPGSEKWIDGHVNWVFLAAEENRWEMVKYLILKGSDIDFQVKSDPGYRGACALTFALEDRNEEMIKWLLEKGAKTGANHRLFRLSIQQRRPDLVEFFIKHGATVASKDDLDNLIEVSQHFGMEDMGKTILEKFGPSLNIDTRWDIPDKEIDILERRKAIIGRRSD